MLNINKPRKTPQQRLFEQVSKRKFPEFSYDISSDFKMCELENLKQKYLQTLNIEDKKNLLLKEREIVYEELDRPELTLARNYHKLANVLYNMNEYDGNLTEIINTINFSALQRLEGILSDLYAKCIDKTKYKEAIPKDKIYSILKKELDCVPDSDNQDFLKVSIENIYNYIKNIIPFSKDEKKEFEKLLLKNNNSEKTEETALKKLQNVFMHADKNNKKTIKTVTEILKSNETDLEKRQLAILAGGKFKSKETFEILKKIASDVNEKSPIARQNAIQSLSLYLRKEPQAVEDVLEKVKAENSEFSPLAIILLDKIKGNYHGKQDREIQYNFFHNKDTASLRDKFNKILKVDTHLNGQLLNKIDSNLMPFANIFKDKKITITDDTVTKYLKHEVGERIFFFEEYPNIGYYMDSIDGISSNIDGAITNKNSVKEILNVVSHELGHSLNFIFNDTRAQKKLNILYKKAVEKDRCLDYFAELSPAEYFAQGCEAYVSFYKPHKDLLNCLGYQDPYCNTRYKLMEKDPELFNFIKQILEKYSSEKTAQISHKRGM